MLFVGSPVGSRAASALAHGLSSGGVDTTMMQQPAYVRWRLEPTLLKRCFGFYFFMLVPYRPLADYVRRFLLLEDATAAPTQLLTQRLRQK